MSAVIVEGARRAACLAALLFTFELPAAAAAQPTVMPGTAANGSSVAARPLPLAIDGPIAGSGLTLAAHHVDVHVAGGRASVRTRLLLRNDSGQTVWAQYVLPQTARLARGDAWGIAALHGAQCDDDLSAPAAEVAETAAPPQRLMQRHDVVVVAAGEEVTVEVEREIEVAAAGAVWRLSLPLPVDREAPWVPRFSADVLVEAERPIRRLASPTHEALVDGIGERTALLSVDGFVYRQAQLIVEFELDGSAAAAAPFDRQKTSAAR